MRPLSIMSSSSGTRTAFGVTSLVSTHRSSFMKQSQERLNEISEMGDLPLALWQHFTMTIRDFGLAEYGKAVYNEFIQKWPRLVLSVTILLAQFCWIVSQISTDTLNIHSSTSSSSSRSFSTSNEQLALPESLHNTFGIFFLQIDVRWLSLAFDKIFFLMKIGLVLGLFELLRLSDTVLIAIRKLHFDERFRTEKKWPVDVSYIERNRGYK